MEKATKHKYHLTYRASAVTNPTHNTIHSNKRIKVINTKKAVIICKSIFIII